MKLNIRCNKINKLIALGCAEWVEDNDEGYLQVTDSEGQTWVVLANLRGQWEYYTIARQWIPMNPQNREELLLSILHYKYKTGY